MTVRALGPAKDVTNKYNNQMTGKIGPDGYNLIMNGVSGGILTRIVTMFWG